MAITLKNKNAEPYDDGEIYKNKQLDRDRLIATLNLQEKETKKKNNK